MEKDKFDQIFDEAFDEAAKNLSVPDPTASWNRIEGKLKRRSKRKTWLHIFPYLVASFILGAAIFGTPDTSKAFSPIFKSMNSIKDNVVSFIFGTFDTTNTTAKTAPPPDASEANEAGSDLTLDQVTERQYSSWEDVTQQKAFTPLSIAYIPDGFVQSDVMLFFRPMQETASKAVLLLTNEANERLLLTLNMLESSEQITSNNELNNGTAETITINGSEVYLFSTSDQLKNLEYLYKNIHISLSGSLSKEELIKIVSNIK
ncbi:MAG: DUF4367 domain-containing protein [Candidatus Pristimantibacillus sp.]